MKRATHKAVKFKLPKSDPDFWANDFIVYEPINPSKPGERPIPKPIKLKGKKSSLAYVRDQRR